jgi:hypothetical protein
MAAAFKPKLLEAYGVNVSGLGEYRPEISMHLISKPSFPQLCNLAL